MLIAYTGYGKIDELINMHQKLTGERPPGRPTLATKFARVAYITLTLVRSFQDFQLTSLISDFWTIGHTTYNSTATVIYNSIIPEL